MWDWYDHDYYGSSPSSNPQGPSSGSYRVLRGGSWDYFPEDLRASLRVGIDPAGRINFIGFRCAQDE